MTGIVTAAWMPSIIAGSLMRATPPSTRMSAGTRSSAITATAKSKDAGWSSSAGVFKAFGGQRQLSLEALLNGVIGQPVGVQDYGLQMKWSQPIHQDFVIGEVIVGHFWPRSDPALPRDRAWAIGTGVKLKF